MREIDVPVLIIGGGGCGLCASIFLSDQGIEHHLVERHETTSPFPKAHYLNQRTMEVMRSHGLDEAIYAVGTPPQSFRTIRWMTSLGGQGPMDRREIYALEMMDQDYVALLERDSPSLPSNYPQMRLEPIFRAAAEQRAPGSVHFNRELVDWEETGAGVRAQILDRATGETYIVRSRYMIAADGGRTIGPKLGIAMVGPTQMVKVVAAHFTADLSAYVPDDTLITRLLNPDGEGSWASGSLVKMGPKWDRHSEEWVVHFAFRPDDPEELDESSMAERIRAVCKLPDLDLKVLRVGRWSVDRVQAERVREGSIFLVGDSVHRHPPTTGLGLNGGIQDTHNLCWKIAAVLKGQADDALLDSYGAERLPVAVDNCDWALSASLNFRVIDMAMGLLPGAPPEMNMAAMESYFAPTRVGASIRARTGEVIRTQRIEFQAHDIEIGFAYENGAIVPDGSEASPRDPFGTEYRPTTRPGHRLPHAWVIDRGKRMSTLDLVQPGNFVLIAGDRGQAWVEAAAAVARETGVSLKAVRISGERDWEAVREIAQDGAVLIRPDQHVGWRAMTMAADPAQTLRQALAGILRPSATRAEASALQAASA